MSAGLNQYAVYRLRRDRRETRTRRHQSFDYLKDHDLKVESDLYEQVYLAGFDPAQSLMTLRRSLEEALPKGITGETLAIGDVLAVTRDGVTCAYYVDPDRLLQIPGFFHVAASAPTITTDTADFQIEGRPGNWGAVDEIWLDGHHFFLMQSMRFGKSAAYAVIDSHGRQAADDTLQGFTDEVRRQLRAYIAEQDEVNLQTAAATPATEPGATEDPPQGDTELYAASAGPSGSTSTKMSLPISKESAGNSQNAGQLNTKGKKKRRAPHRRKKGKLPLKGRKSVLERLRR